MSSENSEFEDSEYELLGSEPMDEAEVDRLIEEELRQFEEYGRPDEVPEPNCQTLPCRGFHDLLRRERCRVQLGPNESCSNHPECRALYMKYKFETCSQVTDCLPFDAKDPIERQKSISQLRQMLIATKATIKQAKQCIKERLYYRETCMYPAARTSGHIAILRPAKKIQRVCVYRAAAIFREMQNRLDEADRLLEIQLAEEREKELERQGVEVLAKKTTAPKALKTKTSSGRKSKAQKNKTSAKTQGLQTLAELDEAIKEIDSQSRSSTTAAANQREEEKTDETVLLVFKQVQNLFDNVKQKTNKYVNQTNDEEIPFDFYECFFELLWNMFDQTMEIATEELGETQQNEILQSMRAMAAPFLALLKQNQWQRPLSNQYMSDFKKLLLAIHKSLYIPVDLWNRLLEIWGKNTKTSLAINSGRNVKVTLLIYRSSTSEAMRERQATQFQSEIDKDNDQLLKFSNEIPRERYR
jgi:hypothetical protein